MSNVMKAGTSWAETYARCVSVAPEAFDPDRILGVSLPGGVPLDEILFFMVIPLAAILTLEAVRSVRAWKAGDEA